VVGRSKDLLILNGVNHYPQDLELTAERAHPAVRPGGCAAFALEEGGGERAALVVEIERTARRTDAQEIVDAVRRAIADEHQVLAGTVALVRPGAIPRTTSGKVQRRLCRARLLAGELAGYREPAANARLVASSASRGTLTSHASPSCSSSRIAR